MLIVLYWTLFGPASHIAYMQLTLLSCFLYKLYRKYKQETENQ